MLLKVRRGGTKTYVKLDEVHFSDFIRAVQQKFLIPENTMLKVTDEQGIEVDEDVFPEVATVQDICFVIYTDYDLPLAESSKNMDDCSNLTESVDCSNLTECVILKTCDLTNLQQHALSGETEGGGCEETGIKKSASHRTVC
ncbi:E3 ubiquitin-protein ligase HERC2 [Dissostichus eleginoides]|uniref:E3 ubiquitin-protein ligase HERC2 n=1 Tax=Dissostichus eleginoides TaxID=100907 RepID=A0AAD9C2V4_DISEL|nr:E3 ubiquitin-protein ligase HERC2 [Dissostichus eleginoides]